MRLAAKTLLCLAVLGIGLAMYLVVSIMERQCVRSSSTKKPTVQQEKKQVQEANTNDGQEYTMLQLEVAMLKLDVQLYALGQKLDAIDAELIRERQAFNALNEILSRISHTEEKKH